MDKVDQAPGGASRRAVVTGGASGIGAAVVRRLLRAGHSVIAADQNADGLRALEREGAEAVVVDVTGAGEREALIRRAGPLDYLVNAAGIIRVSPLSAVDEGQWREIFAVNVEAAFFLMRGFQDHMAPGGAIVNVSSMAAKSVEIEAAVYAASKAALLSLTRSFAYALAPRSIRVNAVCPGIIDTPMQDAFVPKLAEWRGLTVEEFQGARLKSVPLQRMGAADEVAALICFLLSDGASYMTAQSVNVTGGLIHW